MAKDKKRILRKRANKKARPSARKAHAKMSSGGASRFARMGCTRGELERSPIHGAHVGDSIFSQGLGYTVLARTLPDGRIAAGVFLVDAYCLGIKDAFLTVQSPFRFKEIIEEIFHDTGSKSVDPAYVRKLLDGAIAYARDLGFDPHPDFRDASVVLGDITTTECDAEFTFGHEGKPFYISGPHHSEATARRIVAHLTNRCGPDGFHYLVGVSDPGAASSFGPDAIVMDEDDEELADEEPESEGT